MPRRLIVPLVVFPPIIALGVLSLINGVVSGFIILEGFVAVLLAIWILGQVGTPSKITVVAEGIGAQIRLRPRDFIAWAEVTDVPEACPPPLLSNCCQPRPAVGADAGRTRPKRLKSLNKQWSRRADSNR